MRILRKPPILFPLVTLYHVFLLALHVYYTKDDFLNQTNIVQTCWYVVAVIFLIFICDLKKWANIGYIVLTIVGLLLQFLLPKGSIWHEVGATTLFPFDLLMTVFLLFYYKRFE